MTEGWIWTVHWIDPFLSLCTKIHQKVLLFVYNLNYGMHIWTSVMSHITASVLIVVGGWCKKLFQRINLHPSAVILVAIATWQGLISTAFSIQLHFTQKWVWGPDLHYKLQNPKFSRKRGLCLTVTIKLKISETSKFPYITWNQTKHNIQ